jgi:mono/diheme cytochrome c family protein
MKTPLLCTVAVAGLALGPIASVLSAGQAAKKTIWDGVYSDAQAVRGEGLYKTNCGHCHRDNLSGGGSEAGAPPLVGPMFVSPWNDQPLSEVFLKIGLTMPKNKPDSLTPSIVADILSFMLKVNQIPAGSSELPADLAALKEIQFTSRK